MTSPWTWLKGLAGRAPTCPECHTAVQTSQAHCTTCGYDLVQRAKVDGGGARGPV
jgi:predicted amidophosphoribosyltransferase